MVASLHSGLYRVFYVPLSTGNVMDIYKSIAWELGLPTERSRAALYRVIRAEVVSAVRTPSGRALVMWAEWDCGIQLTKSGAARAVSPPWAALPRTERRAAAP